MQETEKTQLRSRIKKLEAHQSSVAPRDALAHNDHQAVANAADIRRVRADYDEMQAAHDLTVGVLICSCSSFCELSYR